VIEAIVKALTGAGLDLAPREVSELLWLAMRLPASPAGTSVADNDPGDAPFEHVDGTPPPASADTGSKSTVEAEEALKASVFLDVRAANAPSGGTKGRAVALPAPDAMPERQRLRRAFRPFARRRRSDWRRVVDEVATAERTAENDGLLVPVYRAVLERWFEVALVVEDVASMQFWADRIAAFAALLEDRGGFREVQRYSLTVDAKVFTLVNVQKARIRADRLGTTGRQRLVLFVSDGTSAAWRSGLLPTLLHTWAGQMAVAIVNPLPETLWSRTAIGNADATVATITPGPRNSQLLVTPSWWDFDDLGERLAIPVVGLEPASVERWARTIMAAGGADAGAILVSPKLHGAAVGGTTDASADPLDRFERHASEPARLLASYLSAAPLTLPVMRLVQHAMLPSSEPSHLAEVFLSGLVERVTPAASKETPDRVQYDFIGDVRERLQSGLFEGEALRVLALVARLLDRLSGMSDRRTTVAAVVADARGTIPLPDDMQLLTRVSKPLLARLGYTDPGAGIEAPTPTPVREVRLSPEATFTHSAPGMQLSWSFDNQQLAILHGDGFSIATTGDTWSIRDFTSGTPWESLPAYRVVVVVDRDAISRNTPGLQELIVEPLIRRLVDGLNDGSRRVDAITVAPGVNALRDVAGLPLTVVPIHPGMNHALIPRFALPQGDQAVIMLYPVALVLPGGEGELTEFKKRFPRATVLDCTAIGTDDEWTRRRISANLGELVRTLVSQLGATPPGTSGAPRFTACAWLAHGLLALGRRESNEKSDVIVEFPLERRANVNDAPVWSGARPVVSLAGLGLHESALTLCGTSVDGQVFAIMPNSSGSAIQSGLGLSRRVAASPSGNAFAYTHHGSGLLAWGPGFQRVRINGGVDASPPEPLQVYPIPVVGFSFVEEPPGDGIRLDVYWATGDLRSFRLGAHLAGDNERGVPVDEKWKLPGPIYAGASSPDGRLAAVAREKAVSVLDRTEVREIASLEVPDLDEHVALEFSRDGRFLAVTAGRTTRIFATAKLPGVESRAKEEEPLPKEDAPPHEEARTQQESDVPPPSSATEAAVPEPQPSFTYDVFISYARKDSEWVGNFERALVERLKELLGRPARVGMVAEGLGTLRFTDQGSATLIAVLSPAYLDSHWTEAQLKVFRDTAAETARGRSRVFKVLRTPVPLNLQPDPFRGLLGYEFFGIEPVSGALQEYDVNVDKRFFLRLDDLAQDIAQLLRETHPAP
jgi:hypothetical protein